MKKITIVLIVFTILVCGCGTKTREKTDSANEVSENAQTLYETPDSKDEFEEQEKQYYGIDDPELLQTIQDTVAEEITAYFDSDDYKVDDVTTAYVSQEYIDDLEYNSKKNVYFGYTAEELSKQFKGQQYVFTVDKTGKTIVKTVATDEIYDEMFKNVAIGTGVILVCVTVSCATGGTVGAIFMVGAKSAAAGALSGAVISGAMTGIVTGIQTKDPEETLRAVELKSSEGYKIGAITGALTGIASKSFSLLKESANAKIPSWRDSELYLEDLTGGQSQITYKDGKVVPYGTKGGTRPDVVREIDNHIEALEIKNYNLENSSSRAELIHEIKREVTDRVTNLPKGSTQKIYLDVRNREFSDELLDEIIEQIKSNCSSVYQNLPVEVIK